MLRRDALRERTASTNIALTVNPRFNLITIGKDQYLKSANTLHAILVSFHVGERMRSKHNDYMVRLCWYLVRFYNMQRSGHLRLTKIHVQNRNPMHMWFQRRSGEALSFGDSLLSTIDNNLDTTDWNIDIRFVSTSRTHTQHTWIIRNLVCLRDCMEATSPDHDRV